MRATRLLPGLLPGVRRLVGNAGAAADVGGVRRVSGSGPAEGWSAWSERASGWRGRVGRGTFAPSAAEISSAPAKETPKHFLVPLPVLSPLMTKGKIVKWHVKVGDCIKENQLLFDVETNTLTVRADHRFTLEVESQEDGYLAAILVQEGEEVDTMRTPIAVVCDEESAVDYFADFKVPSQEAASAAYEKRVFLWQAYVKGQSLDM